MKPAADSTDAQLDALDRLCVRLAGFGADVTLEWLDGALTALVAGPRTVLPSEWLPLLFGDAWERAIADPEDLQQALSTLLQRWNVLAGQLAPEALFDDPQQLRLSPLIEELDPAQRDELLASGAIDAAEAAAWPLPAQAWASGFLAVVERLQADWQLPADAAAADELRALLRAIEILVEPDAAKLHAYVQAHYRAAEPPDRDALIDDACFAVQDLRCFWLERQTRPSPRQVAKAPGRNDPCPCGSGRKFKKCHGAPGALH